MNSQGRFARPDPLLASAKPVQPQSWNRYTYCLNNPLKYVDPTGLEYLYKFDKQHNRFDYQWVTGKDLEEALGNGWREVPYDENGRYQFDAIDENGNSLGKYELRRYGMHGFAQDLEKYVTRNLADRKSVV